MARKNELTVNDVIQLVKGGCINEYGRVSIHLHDNTGRCVYDLDCEVEELPNIVWREYMDCISGVWVGWTLPGVGTRNRHVDLARENARYGVPLMDVYEDFTGCYWTNDEGKHLFGFATPKIMTAYYYDSAYAAPYDCSTIA